METGRREGRKEGGREEGRAYLVVDLPAGHDHLLGFQVGEEGKLNGVDKEKSAHVLLRREGKESLVGWLCRMGRRRGRGGGGGRAGRRGERERETERRRRGKNKRFVHGQLSFSAMIWPK